MAARDQSAVPRREPKREHRSETTDALVTVHRTTPDRVVFTEADNHDGWIATDLAVELRR